VKLLCWKKHCHENSSLLAEGLTLYDGSVIVNLYKRGRRKQSIMALIFHSDVCARVLFLSCTGRDKSRQ
jgi:hypothetical protein